MVLQVEDFKESALAVDDYETPNSKKVRVNDRTAAQLAAGQTVLSTGSREEYEQKKAQLLDPETKAQFIVEQDSIRQRLFEDARAGITDIIANPATSFEDKAAAYTGSTFPLPPKVMTSSLDVLSEEALVADSGPDETERDANARSRFFDMVNASNQHKNEMTKLVNGLNLEPTTAGMVKDVAEMMAPFAEWIHYDRLLKEVKGESSTNLLGQQKQELFDFIKDQPLEKRAEMAQALVDIVQSSDTMVLPDGNDLATLETLQNMLIENEYSDFERYFDNVTSVLDIIGVGALVRGTVKSGRAAKAAKTVDGFKMSGGPNTKAESAAASKTENVQFQKDLEAGNFLSPEQAELSVANEVVKEFKSDIRNAGIEETGRKVREKVDTLFRQAKSHIVRTEVTPTAPSQVVKEVNPTLAREMHKTVLEDETGEAAQALYGTNKTEALAKDILPEPQIEGGKMPHKVEMAPEPESFRKNRTRSGNTILSPREKGVLKTKMAQSLDEIQGMVMHPSSLVVRTNVDDTIGFTARYSPTDAGFESPSDAIEAAQVAFRNYGLTPDNFSIMARRGDEWVEAPIKDLHAEIDLKAAGAKGEGLDATEYAIGIKFDHRIGANDIDLIGKELDNLTTHTGLVTRLIDEASGQWLAKQGQGSLQQNLFDSHSVIHPRIVNAASVAVDRALGVKKLYVDAFQDFNDDYKNLDKVFREDHKNLSAEAYNKLDKKRRTKMTDYIHKANLEGISYDVTDLYSRGFTQHEVATLKKWRDANDIMWHAANGDMVQSLKARGMRVFTHFDSDTNLMGRPVKRGGVSSSSVYDPVAGTVVRKSKEELDELYEMGGEVVKLEEAIEVDGRYIDQVVSANTPSGGYTRVIRDDEKVLAYREGYYPVMYDANRFVYKRFKDADGNPRTKVFAATKTSEDADSILKGIQKEKGLTDAEMAETYGVRKDKRIEAERNSLFDAGAWDVSANSGLSSQRLRGKRLDDGGGSDLQGLGKGHLTDPLEAVAKQIQTLSQRVSMRTYMDMAKKRWMQQYGEYLDIPTNPKTGQVDMPKGVGDIRGKDGADAKIVAAAKANYNYLYSLESGHINGIDKLYRGGMHLAADAFAKMGMSLGERAAFGAANYSPTQAGKTVAFKLFISANPLRQALIQRGQMLMLGAHNPEYALKSMTKDLVNLRIAQTGRSKDPKYVKLWKEVEDAGIIESVDAHTLIRDDLLKMADFSALRTVGDKLMSPINALQKIGFDWAEQDVLLSAWLSARDKAHKINEALPKSARRNMRSQEVRDEILGEARAFTLNMNRSGEMPYSQNSLGMATQFLSFQHKALLQGFTNRSLTKKQRAIILGYSAAMFGMDTTIIYGVTDAIFGKEPSELKDNVKAGLLDTTLNWGLTQLSGEDQMIDFGDFAPSNAYGTGNTFISLLHTPLPEMLVNSPAGSMMFGASPRVRDAFTTGFKYFVPAADYDDTTLEVKYTDVILGVLHMFSGASNIFKANYAFKYGKKMSSTGSITDDEVTKVAAVSTLFGFRTKTEESSRLIAEKKYGANGDYMPDEVEIYYSEMKRHLARRYDSVRDFDLAQRVLGEVWEVFGDDRPNVINQLTTKIQNDANEGNYKFVKGILQMMGTKTEDEVWEQINLLPAGTERDRLTALMKHREDNLDGS